MATWPDQRTLGELISQAGWEDVAWFNLTGGMVALHRATKPKPKAEPEATAEAAEPTA
jgi:demethylmenaquinone methyltransferase/2-methoxy-6-polyprenyl-1,4-benzoquinol methylase